MKFGKLIQAQQVPGWSQYYLDYKFLKKIISSLASNRPASEAASLALGVRPSDIFNQSHPSADTLGGPPLFSSSGQDDDRGPDFQAHKAAFFFKLERELEKINAFYLQKEAELQLRLETLLSKRRAAAMRGIPDPTDDSTQLNVEWSAVEEGFRLLERDLGKLQQYVEINATGFRKILKKFDKRSTSATKELYLARRVDIQPVFNRQLISELSDTVATCLLDLTDLSSGLQFEGSAATDIFTQQLMMERAPHMGPYRDLENSLRKAVMTSDRTAIADCARFSDSLAQQNGGKPNVSRILWNAILEAPPELADLILASVSIPFDFQYVDDINGRTCLHEAAITGALRLVNLCLDQNVQADKADVYGRTAMHYGAMYGFPEVCRRLLQVQIPPNALDRDNCSPLVYATLRGSVECVRVLIEEGHVPVQSIAEESDLDPLTLASQSGHVDVVMLLLQHSAKCLPNTNGEYPMHLAASEGHTEVCRLLLHLDGWDTPDKYHEWTPVFHAARHGHFDCIKLLVKAGCKVDVRDEMGHLAVHYAAWYGHHTCVDALLHATPTIPPTNVFENLPRDSPSGAMEDTMMSEIDMIPSLSLPPPIMPHRVYGHNYLDKTYLIQVTIGHAHSPTEKFSGVTLHHRLISPTLKDKYLLASSPLKLVMTTDSDTGTAPYTISLPQREQSDVFAFQIPSLDKLSLKFSVYPNFGTKTIGRAVALPSLFVDIRNTHQFVLPILDHRLQVIGEVPFEVNVITPFENVTLEVGGGVETYWKSTASAIPSFSPSPAITLAQGIRQTRRLGSTQTSPSAFSIASTTTSTRSQALTITSLRGDYIYVVVQVTKDLHPVAYTDWRLPEPSYDLGVSDITLAQFEALALKCGRALQPGQTVRARDWPKLNIMVSLAQLMLSIPTEVGMSLELAYASRRISQRFGPGNRLNLNNFVDAVLRTIHQASALNGKHARRNITFGSFSPDICSALNWKQPNYSVFFSSTCGRKLDHSPSLTVLNPDDDNDRRLASLSAAVDFARTNNLLGIWVDANLLVRTSLEGIKFQTDPGGAQTQVPSLIHEIKEAGLLVGIYSATDIAPEIDGCPVDAYLRDGNVVYADLSTRNPDFTGHGSMDFR
ncbi:ubiquitin-protein ligase peroxin 12 [Pleurotus pulmonarius]|nr:ubiquitin-protein ligase peroxin 12 [Pleurotus pulmonarius]KAF4600733.1 ubiquitin-protein ligase peroxin 12 [Pleurotus pulmonarius]